MAVMVFERRWAERVGWAAAGAAAVHMNHGELGAAGFLLVLGVVALMVARW